MKLKRIVITTAIIYVVASSLVSCSKEENSGQIDTTEISTDDLISKLKTSIDKSDISENYIEPEYGITGTLYKIQTPEGETADLLITEKEPELPSEYGPIQRRTMNVWTDEYGNGWYSCSGAPHGNCIRIGRITIAW